MKKLLLITSSILIANTFFAQNFVLFNFTNISNNLSNVNDQPNGNSQVFFIQNADNNVNIQSRQFVNINQANKAPVQVQKKNVSVNKNIQVKNVEVNRGTQIPVQAMAAINTTIIENDIAPQIQMNQIKFPVVQTNAPAVQKKSFDLNVNMPVKHAKAVKANHSVKKSSKHNFQVKKRKLSKKFRRWDNGIKNMKANYEVCYKF